MKRSKLLLLVNNTQFVWVCTQEHCRDLYNLQLWALLYLTFIWSLCYIYDDDGGGAGFNYNGVGW